MLFRSRKSFKLDSLDLGKQISLQFDGIFRDSRIWVNGFFLGHEPSGYATQVYDITDYLNYDGRENLIAVRADASLEEGWFYEGAGIYRNVWLNKNSKLHVAPFGTFIHSNLNEDFSNAVVTIETTLKNSNTQLVDNVSINHTIKDSDEIGRAHV